MKITKPATLARIPKNGRSEPDYLITKDGRFEPIYQNIPRPECIYQKIARDTAKNQMIEYMLGRSESETKAIEGQQKVLCACLKKLALIDMMTSTIIDNFLNKFDMYERHEEYERHSEDYFQLMKEDANRLKDMVLRVMCNCCTELPQVSKYNYIGLSYLSTRVDGIFDQCHELYIDYCRLADMEIKEFDIEVKYNIDTEDF